MKKFAQGMGASLLAVLAFAPAAFGATPDEIYTDLADNGRLDGTYTQAEMQAFLQSAQVQGYGNPVVTPPVVAPPAATPPAATPPAATLPAATPPAITPDVTPPAAAPAPAVTPAPAAAPEAGVAGVSKTQNAKPAAARPASSTPTTGVAGVQTPLTQTATVGTLPFTGSELGLFALVGGALLLGGLLLRASARRT